MGSVNDTDLDRLYKIASNKRRRTVIDTLLQTSGEIHLEELLSQLETDQSESGRSEQLDQERKRVKIELIHQHLPMLHDAGFIEFDRSQMSISPRSSLEQFEKIFPDSSER